MGKKSRKKGATKGARKDQQPSNRSQQSAAPPAPGIRPQRDGFETDVDYSNAFSNPNQREYFVGDRIWFVESLSYDPLNPNTYRGMVRGILPDGRLRIISLQSIISGHEEEIFTLARDKVYPDFEDIMLRFNVGDAVLYNCYNCWSTGKVELQWPIREIYPCYGDVLPVDATCNYSFPHYKCKVDWQDPGALFPHISVLGDDDTLIRLRPTTFRFKVGDAVDINPKEAETINGRSAATLAQCTTLMRGKIVAVDVSKPQMNYAVYECSFGKALTCRIFEDTDAYISRADADPRERLFDAIEQNCSRDHLDFLCNQFSIDVLTFKDLVVAKAIESASLEALSWLQLSCRIDVQSMKDECGNNFLHQIAKSSHAASFIRKAGRGSCGKSAYPKLNFRGGDGSLHYQLNNDGELWIQILIKRGDVKALDAALSPHYGFAWDLLHMRPEQTKLLQISVRESESPMMQFIFDSFLSFSELYCRYSCLQNVCGRTENELLNDENLVAFREGDASQSAKLLVRYCRDWYHHRSKYVLDDGQLFTFEFVLFGYFQLFQSFYEADEAGIRNTSYYVKSRDDKGEYIQHELYKQEQNDDLEVDIFSACIIGRETFPSRRNEWSKSKKSSYMEHIRRYAMQIDPRGYPSLHDHLQEIFGGQENFGGRDMDLFSMQLERLKLLNDDDNIEGRQKILEYLLRNNPALNLDALLPIKHRQCWALRFLISKSVLQMDSLAIRSHSLIKAAQGLLFLQDGRLEKTSLKLCLCFAAVQYDDLQSLEFLCEPYGTPVEMIGGWNLLHFSAYMGRVEIIAWLSSRPVWDSLSTQRCVRKGFEGALAVHISARRGHLVACDLMIDLKVPLEDSNGRVPEDYAKMSSHQYVLDWVKNRETPKVLKTAVNKLFKLAKDCSSDVNKLKDFVKSSSCLDICTWRQCGCLSFEALGPTGCSFGDVLHEICGAVNIEVAEWICKRLYFWDGFGYEHERFWKSSEQKQRESHAEYRAAFDKKLEEKEISIEVYNDHTKDLLPVQEQDHVVKEMLTQHDLVEFLRNQGHDDLSGLLSNMRFKNFSCKEPLTSSILSSALDEGERCEIVRAAILLHHIQLEIHYRVRMDIYSTLERGGRVDEVEELINTKSFVMNALIREGLDTSTRITTPSQYHSPHYFTPIDMNLRLHKYNKDHPLRKGLLFLHSTDLVVPQLSVVLATEGYAELMDFCLSNLSGWNTTMELDAAQISSYFGHSAITEIFLDDSSKSFLSSVDERQNKIILGTGEALRFRELESLVDRVGAPADPIADFDMNEVITKFGEYSERLSQSLLVCVMNGYLKETSNDDNKTSLKTLSFLVDRLGYSHDEILIALILITNVLHCIEEMNSIFDIVWNVINIIGLQPIQHNQRLRTLCEAVTNQIVFLGLFEQKEENNDNPSITKRLSEMADLGIDVQKLLDNYKYGGEGYGALAMRMLDKPFISELRKLEEKQRKEWSNFAVIKNGASLQKIQHIIHRGDLRVDARDQGGLLLTHLSAAYDRVDLLEWLVTTKGMRLTSKDFKGRTALDVAEGSKATKAMTWIAEWNARNRIASFLRRNLFRAMQTRRLEKAKNAAILIQRRVRGYFMRNLYSGALSHRLEESKRFHDIWGGLLESMPRFLPMSWSSTREKYLDIKVGIDDELIDETDRRLKEAVDVAVDQDVEDDTDGVTDEANASAEVLSTNHDYSSAAVSCTSSNEWLSFQMTSHVVKFLQQGDKKYRSFFVRRMQQLARGERSRILKKPLKGSQSHIFETYLEQKSGHRILWTEEGGSIVVWYVARHKQVSRLMQLIDDSKSRSARQQMPQTLSDELRNDGLVSSTEPKRGVLLDIIGNVPLKVYDISFNSLNEIAKDSWTPRLHLTEEERDIVEADGTVLVLGRSGTGKTVCICNRIECDRQTRAGCDPSFTQLFVARSMRLCKYVEGAVGEDHRTSFYTYLKLLADIEATLPDQQDRRNFNPSNKMDFQRFKREIYNNSSSNTRVSALILWTTIRTFLKGSIEAFQSPSGILPKEDFLEVERLGKNRCRIPEEFRGYIYDAFLRYESYLKERELWDDCDRVHHLMIRIKQSKEVDPDAFGQVKKSRVYVDEVQDYTQLEILLFFYLCGPNGLCLAGDPAQSVVEGTEFRFEEVRSVGHFVGSLIQKPKTVNVNFRSHSGILNCAGGVLDLMFAHFPSSAKQLKKDEGLFQGSRPGILSGSSIDQLNLLLSDKLKGAVVLTHDDSASHWRRKLNDYKRVYGIREAKGLEFKTVIILDFFNELPPSLQKPWRELVLDRAEQDFEYKHPLVGNMLKLLYTGVTRCIEKLFFVETSLSTAGKASIRWLTKNITESNGSFATMNNIDDVESMSMTVDEFVGEGINNAELSESAEDLDEAERYLERAVWCFEQADNADLAAKARIQHSSVLFRRDLQLSRDEIGMNNHAVIEMKAANMMGSLCREGLYTEAANIFYAVKPYMSEYVCEKLEREVVSVNRLAE